MTNMRRLDVNKINRKSGHIISTKDSLKEVTPINWSDGVIMGKTKVSITIKK